MVTPQTANKDTRVFWETTKIAAEFDRKHRGIETYAAQTERLSSLLDPWIITITTVSDLCWSRSQSARSKHSAELVAMEMRKPVGTWHQWFV